MKIDRLLLAPSGAMPNHPDFPVLIYQSVAGAESSRSLEALFEQNGWEGIWRNGVFAYHHYHTTAHEVLGVGRGKAKLQIGGPDGPVLNVERGDCLLLPAGTGHKRIECSGDFEVVGAYPNDADVDVQREAATEVMLRNIRELPIPHLDPVLGAEGGLRQYWVGL